MYYSKMKAEKRRETVFDYIKDFCHENGYAPTVREIGSALGIKSTSTVFSDIRCLEEADLIRIDKNKSRAIVLVEKSGMAEAARAAEVIRSFCDSYETCDECPAGNGHCTLCEEAFGGRL